MIILLFQERKTGCLRKINSVQMILLRLFLKNPIGVCVSMMNRVCMKKRRMRRVGGWMTDGSQEFVLRRRRRDRISLSSRSSVRS